MLSKLDNAFDPQMRPEVRRSTGGDGDKCFTYEVKADGLQDLLVTTADKLVQFSPARRTRQTFLLIRPWNRYDLDLIDFTDESQSVDDWPDDPGDDELVTRELRLLVRLARPFNGLLLAQQRGGEYKRIASDNNIIAQVKDMTSVHDMMDVRMLEILRWGNRHSCNTDNLDAKLRCAEPPDIDDAIRSVVLSQSFMVAAAKKSEMIDNGHHVVVEKLQACLNTCPGAVKAPSKILGREQWPPRHLHSSEFA
ncbi:hypothetical protein EV424DRAFT_1348913 [Suillus variegatus]|nr:hypothetical protein EV424DRAFT_1348913 [Suillus variegatus]